MDSAFSIAASGLSAASLRLSASASNIANAQSTGPVPATPPTQPIGQGRGTVYQPVTVAQSALAGGGISASIAPALPSYSLSYAPSSPYANAQGMVATPNVDPVREVTDEIGAKLAYRANLATLRVADSTERSLIDTVA
jgi:flagellar basal-body rod protein FlgC